MARFFFFFSIFFLTLVRKALPFRVKLVLMGSPDIWNPFYLSKAAY